MGEETENESESGDSVLQWAMRRREASDDDADNENSEGEERERERTVRMSHRRVGVGFGDESDGLGGAAAYGDDGVTYIDELEQLGEEVLEVKEEEEEEVVVLEEDSRTHEEEEEREVKVAEVVMVKQRKEEKNSEEEPFVEPRIGAFYMHDDRFGGRRGRGRGRYRQTFDGRNSKEFKDERKWRHDKFEELTLRETRYEEVNASIEVRRTSEGYYQGRQKNQGRGHGYVKANESKRHDDSKNQNHSLKTVRGRGPVKYKPIIRSSDANPPTNNKRSGKPPGMTLKTDSAGAISLTSNVDCNSLASKKHVSASSTRSALHTFSPASSSNHDISVTQKRDVQPRRTNGKCSTSVLPRENICVSQTCEFPLGNAATDFIGWDRLYGNESIHPVAGNYPTSMPLQSSMTWPAYTGEAPQFRGQERGLSLSALLTHQSASRQVNRVSQMAQYPAIQQIPVESTVQPPLRVNAQKLTPRSGSGSQASSKALPLNISEAGIEGSLPGSSRFGKGSNVVQGSSRASLHCGGILGDQNFTSTPTLLPVMQFGGQYHGGLGDPALDMALAGYITQSQVGFGTSEMPWVPALPVAAGAVGAAYLPPYVTPDSGYNVHSSDKIPSLGVASNTLGTGKLNYDVEPPDTTEIVNKQFGQRRIKPIRYSKMNFNQ